MCHPQGTRSQYLAKLRKYVNEFVGNTFKNVTYVFLAVESQFLKLL